MLFKPLSLLAALPLASAFVPAAPRMSRGRSLSMNFGYEEGVRPVGGVQMIPGGDMVWDPCNLQKRFADDPAYEWRVQNAEIKNGRVAMLACIHYFVTGLGYKLPITLGGISTADIPGGLKALEVVPLLGWAQIVFACGILEVLTDRNVGWPMEGKVPGNQQPDTPLFKVPGDVQIRTKEINNGRLAMVSILGMWVGELVSGGQMPLETLADKWGINLLG